MILIHWIKIDICGNFFFVGKLYFKIVCFNSLTEKNQKSGFHICEKNIIQMSKKSKIISLSSSLIKLISCLILSPLMKFNNI